jgi:hypothetical protein
MKGVTRFTIRLARSPYSRKSLDHANVNRPQPPPASVRSKLKANCALSSTVSRLDRSRRSLVVPVASGNDDGVLAKVVARETEIVLRKNR